MVSIDFNDCGTPMEMVSTYANTISPANCYKDSNVALLTSLVNERFHLRLSRGTILGLLRIYRPTTGGNPAATLRLPSQIQRTVSTSPDFYTIAAPDDMDAPGARRDEQLYRGRKAIPPRGETPRYAPEAIRSGARETGRRKTKGIDEALTEPYATFARMRLLTESDDETMYQSYTRNRIIRFIKQAEFMKDFEDDCPQAVPLITLFNLCAYEHMDDDQLRTYFTWRARVRQGKIAKVSAAYFLCYINELINDIGVSSPVEAMEQLIAIRQFVFENDVNLNVRLDTWIRDYYIIHAEALRGEYNRYYQYFPMSPALSLRIHGLTTRSETDDTARKILSQDWADLEIVELSSTHRITKGILYKRTDPRAVEACVCAALHAMDACFRAHDLDLKQLFLSERETYIDSLLNQALFDDSSVSLSEPYEVRISPFDTVRMEDEDWMIISLTLDKYSAVVGYILKAMEVIMRKHFGVPNSLRMPKIETVQRCLWASDRSNGSIYERYRHTHMPNENAMLMLMTSWKRETLALIQSDEFEEAIEAAVSAYCAKHGIMPYTYGDASARSTAHVEPMAPAAPVEIDMSQLDRIRAEHMHTAARLNTDEDVGVGVASGAMSDARLGDNGEQNIAVGTDGSIARNGLVEQNDTSNPGSPGALGTPDDAAPSGSASGGFPGLAAALTDAEHGFLASLLRLGDGAASGTSGQASRELLAEAINEKALTHINDNLIEGAGSLCAVYDEYVDELSAALEQRSM